MQKVCPSERAAERKGGKCFIRQRKRVVCKERKSERAYERKYRAFPWLMPSGLMSITFIITVISLTRTHCVQYAKGDSRRKKKSALTEKIMYDRSFLRCENHLTALDAGFKRGLFFISFALGLNMTRCKKKWMKRE